MKDKFFDIKIKKPSAYLILFVLFNAVYLLRAAGILSQIFYYVTIVAYCGYCLLLIAVQNKNKDIRQLNFYTGFRNIIIVVLSFWLISVIKQMVNGHAQTYLYTDLFELLMPALCTFCILNTDKDNFNLYLYILFIRAIAQFFIESGANLSLESIFAIDWNDSSSSLTESASAHIFCLLTIVFLFQKKYIPAVLSTLFCILAFKRVAFIVCIASWIICRFIPNKKIPSAVYWIISIICILTPFFVLMVYSESGADLFYELFGLDLNQFTMGRFNMIKDTLNHFNGDYFGFGSVKEYFADMGGVYAARESFHCDILRIYLECTIIGVIIFVFATMNISRKSWRSLYLFAYLFIELTVSHFLGRFIEWMIFYMFTYYAECLSNNAESNKTLMLNTINPRRIKV